MDVDELTVIKLDITKLSASTLLASSVLLLHLWRLSRSLEIRSCHQTLWLSNHETLSRSATYLARYSPLLYQNLPSQRKKSRSYQYCDNTKRDT
ncbi:Hypothetical protein VS_II1400 [Vibrio atlanticus]|uniref:Uncharacterized protein n=1 Tax=Vibrio atlanticus (strain LGP32) TaxID=575788 RepID=B7VTE6_VIBA3|nr:Hypothetical protein VS_II1400 [Vibrio atlanticus]